MEELGFVWLEAGGVYGHVHATLGCCIDNISYYEYMSYAPDTLRKQGERWAMVNAPVVEDGHLTPAYLPGWGAEWDEDRFQSLILSKSVIVPWSKAIASPGCRFDDRINGIGRSSGVDYR